MVDASQCKAINIALLPDKRGVAIAQQFNRMLRDKSSSCFAFDHAHHPHITLFQMYVKSDDIPEVITRVEDHLREFKTGEVFFKELEKGSNFADEGSEYLPSLSIRDPKNLISSLHNKVANLVSDLRVKKVQGNRRLCFFSGGSSVTNKSMEYVSKFYDQSSFDKYSPHMAIGIGKENEVEEVVNKQLTILQEEKKFKSDKLVVGHLGNYCTCTQIIQEWAI